MPFTSKQLWWPNRTETFPDGFAGNEAGENGILRRMQESVDAAFDTTGTVALGTYTNTSAENTSAFTDIPPDFEMLKLIWMGRIEDAATGFESVLMRINGDAGATSYYSSRYGIRQGTTPSFQSASNYEANGQLSMGIVGEQASWGEITIPRYARAVSKDVSARGAARISSGTSASDKLSTFGEGIWTNTAPVESIRIWPSGFNWATGMRMILIAYPKVS